jgi:hypothetical protein
MRRQDWKGVYMKKGFKELKLMDRVITQTFYRHIGRESDHGQ